jgi:hypothetical protein
LVHVRLVALHGREQQPDASAPPISRPWSGTWSTWCAAAVRGRERAVHPVVVAAPDAEPASTSGWPVIGDAEGRYRELYSPGGPSVYLVRPDGHVGFLS